MTANVYPNVISLYKEKCAAFDKLAAASLKLCENHEALLNDYDEVIEDYRDLSTGYDAITEALHDADIQVDLLRRITSNDALTFFEQEEQIQNQQKQIQDLQQYAEACNIEAIDNKNSLQGLVDHLVIDLGFTPTDCNSYDY